RKGMVNKRTFAEAFSKAIRDFLGKNEKIVQKLRNTLKNIEGIEVSTASVGISWKKSLPDLVEILEAMDKWARENKKRLVLAVDEAQELRKLQQVDFIYLLSYIYDHLRNVVVCLTGSEVGVIYDFLNLDDPSSPLYGRAIFEICVKRLEKDRAVEFLSEGFKQVGSKVSKDEIEKTIEKMDGLVGWLTYYGWHSCNDAMPLERIVDSASKLALKEFNDFLENSRSPKRYRGVLEALVLRPLAWSDIKKYLEIKEGIEINDSNFSSILENLARFGFIEKRGELYSIADPVLGFAFSEK
ncbi:MAG: ATP-binding protein, partial [Candidatus Thermoplasmatota archaeon]|nr:ATP-binding protein [Candidatus Thermoplasmatota archaeon]